MTMLRHWFFLLAFFCLAPQLCAEEVYLSHEQFLHKAFAGDTAQARTFWLKPQHKAQAEAIMQHRFNLLRVRYWQAGQKSAWILEEIGKEKPITIGIVINDHSIVSVDILAFRESRGWEVRHAFFTDQFKGLQLLDDLRLDKRIDGVTGATLSVSAVQRCATLALYLAREVQHLAP